MNKKIFYILISIVSLLLGAASAFIPVKITLAAIAGIALLIFLLLDYQRIVYVVGLYPILYFITNKVLDIPLLASTWDELLLIFCIMVWFYKWIADRKEKAYKWTPLEFPLILLFCIGIFLLCINAPVFGISLDGLRAVVEYMLFFFVVVQLLKSEKASKHLIYVMVFVGTYMGFDGIRQYVFRVEMPGTWVDKAEESTGTRVFSIIGNPNALGALMVLLIPLAIALVYSERSFIKKALFSISTAAMGLCLVFTGSRSSWIGFGCAVLVFAILKGDKKLIIGLAVAAALVYSFVPTVQQRIAYLMNPAYQESSMRDGRIVRWDKAMELFRQNFWFGKGQGMFGGSIASINKVPGTFYVDNYYIKTAVEMGIFGLIAFCGLIYNAMAWSLRAYNRVREIFIKNTVLGAFSGMFGVLITNVFTNNFDAPAITTYFWILAGVIMYLGFVNKSNLGFKTAQA